MTYTSNESGEVDLDGHLFAITFVLEGGVTSREEYMAETAKKAKRIADCLNFCEGFDNIILEGRNLSDLVPFLGVTND